VLVELNVNVPWSVPAHAPAVNVEVTVGAAGAFWSTVTVVDTGAADVLDPSLAYTFTV
jgi:hypothetical protein